METKKQLEEQIDLVYKQLKAVNPISQEYIKLRSDLGTASLLYKIEYGVYYKREWLD